MLHGCIFHFIQLSKEVRRSQLGSDLEETGGKLIERGGVYVQPADGSTAACMYSQMRVIGY